MIIHPIHFKDFMLHKLVYPSLQILSQTTMQPVLMNVFWNVKERKHLMDVKGFVTMEIKMTYDVTWSQVLPMMITTTEHKDLTVKISVANSSLEIKVRIPENDIHIKMKIAGSICPGGYLYATFSIKSRTNDATSFLGRIKIFL